MGGGGGGVGLCGPNICTRPLHGWRPRATRRRPAATRSRGLSMKSFQTTLTPNPEKLHTYYSAIKQEETCFWTCSLNAFKFRCRWSGNRSLKFVLHSQTRRRENMVGVNMISAEYHQNTLKWQTANICIKNMFEFDGILLKPCLLQPCFHVAGRPTAGGWRPTNVVANGKCRNHPGGIACLKFLKLLV